MALRRTLAQRLFSVSRDPKPPLTTLEHSPIPSPSFQPPGPSNATRTTWCRRDYSPDSFSRAFFRRFLQRRDMNQSATASAAKSSAVPEVFTFPVGEKLKEKLRTNNGFTGNRIRLDGLKHPAPETDSVAGVSVECARKIMRLVQLEKLKVKLREIPENSISYSEFLQICGEGVGNRDEGAEYAKMLDDSGNVIVLGNVVFLWPEQVAKSMEAFILQSVAGPNDPRSRELEQLEKHKAAIDEKAKAQVRRELYCGLGFLVAQTLGFMRLTFWELSWDVMEPICFFVTSLHFAIGYGFFLRTSSEPSFEGYFQRRFKTKQKRIMEAQKFDLTRYIELRGACCPPYTH